MVNGRFIVEDFRNVPVDVEALAAATTPIAARLAPIVKERRYRPLPV